MIWQEISNIFPKEESTESLTTRYWEEYFFCTIWNIKWLTFPHGCILHSKSFPTSTHTPKSELKRRSYGPDKLEKKNRLLSGNGVATENGVATGNGVATENLCRDQKCCRNLKKAENGVFDLISSPFHPRTIYILVVLDKEAGGKIGEPLSWGFSL